MNMSLLLEVELIAREAGAAIMDIYNSDYSVSTKEDNSLLTEADTAANAIITARLKGMARTFPVLSEEAVDDFLGVDEAGRYWLIDPLDGTKEFVKRNGEFTVNIALIEQGRVVLGVVYAPFLDVLYSAAVGLGAFKLMKDGVRSAIHVAPHLDVNKWRIVGSRSHAGDSLVAILQKLDSYELISMGSSLKFCLVAEGSADVYPRLGLTSLWDTAAAQCVVEQAGGAVVQLNGKVLSYADPSVRLNPYFLVHGNNKSDYWLSLLGENQ